MAQKNKLAILVGGGPAPGINSVIGAATIRARLEDIEVVGIRDGFEWLMQGDSDHVIPLTIDNVSRIHFRGGSHLGIARANPTKDPKLLDNTLKSLQRLDVSQLITIGGDDTAYSAMMLERHAAGALRVVHVPKTIDNDLFLPEHVDTFGFQTARHYGAEIVKNLMVDAKTTSRWYFVIAMGRKAGHLALGIGKAAGATLHADLRGVPRADPAQDDRRHAGRLDHQAAERRPARRRGGDRRGRRPRHRRGRSGGAAGRRARRARAHLRIAEVNLGEILKSQVQARLRQLGIKTTIAAKNIGYELRCADPIPFDMEYTRDLGYCAARYLIAGGNAAMISMQGGHFVPVPFEEITDPETGRTRVRLVDIASTRYAIARRYMIRLRRDDFEDPEEMKRLASTVNLSPDQFRREFESLVAAEPPKLQMDTHGEA